MDKDCIGLKKLYNQRFDLKMDAALNELGMLSTITESRLDYLKEKKLEYLKETMTNLRTSYPRSSSPLCVVHMNSNFVTQLSLTKNSATDCDLPDDSVKTDLVFKYKGMNKTKRNFYQPYCINPSKIRKFRLCKLEEDFHEIQAEVLADGRASPPIITRQDSGNKSNPSSPVKSQNSLTSLGCSIFRSRSLDDLEISKLNLNESCCDIASHGEIDTVSQRISKLHVS